ncbi:MAG: 2Fe-2S iron-sulfur cluster-binding protein [Chthonomonadales bacterium]
MDEPFEPHGKPPRDRRSVIVEVVTVDGSQQFEALAGDTILDALLGNSVDIEHECGGNCSCTTCLVTIVDGEYRLSEMEWPEADRLDTLETRNDYQRLACQALLKSGPVRLRIGE